MLGGGWPPLRGTERSIGSCGASVEPAYWLLKCQTANNLDGFYNLQIRSKTVVAEALYFLWMRRWRACRAPDNLDVPYNPLGQSRTVADAACNLQIRYKVLVAAEFDVLAMYLQNPS